MEKTLITLQMTLITLKLSLKTTGRDTSIRVEKREQEVNID